MLFNLARSLRACHQGSTVSEFALIASLIAVALGSTIIALGAEVESHYDRVETSYSEAAN